MSLEFIKQFWEIIENHIVYLTRQRTPTEAHRRCLTEHDGDVRFASRHFRGWCVWAYRDFGVA